MSQICITYIYSKSGYKGMLNSIKYFQYSNDGIYISIIMFTLQMYVHTYTPHTYILHIYNYFSGVLLNFEGLGHMKLGVQFSAKVGSYIL